MPHLLCANIKHFVNWHDRIGEDQAPLFGYRFLLIAQVLATFSLKQADFLFVSMVL